ncbi:heme ABC exporter ATP-binding protein CcmA [Mangrovicella endophytica]|uniref:heme ABC exporter ATP-binding protein CcmA n=1 Tax=Mangrovicella endophytica TaxID=2066697 RepID=UPI000C9E6C09|nr:heme ABC exporter ATP-binding protein CcmA [Mangrovicella endophytica]
MTVGAAGLYAARGGETVAGPFNFTLAGGEALVVIGANGAGKSTLLRTLAGLLPPGGGSVRIEGAIGPGGEPAERLAEVAHYVGHRNAMKPGLTVAANLSFWRRFLGGRSAGLKHTLPEDESAAIAAALEAVGLPGVASLPFGYLSAGQQRRASLARLLVAPRPVWLLDEPTGALDAASQERLAGIFGRHRDEGGIIIAATHQPLGLDNAGELVVERQRPPAEGFLTEAEVEAAEAWL